MTSKITLGNNEYELLEAVVKEIKRLQDRERFLNALENNGVDNWGGYADAQEEYDASVG